MRDVVVLFLRPLRKCEWLTCPTAGSTFAKVQGCVVWAGKNGSKCASPVVIEQLDVLGEAQSAIIPFVDSISHESSSWHALFLGAYCKRIAADGLAVGKVKARLTIWWREWGVVRAANTWILRNACVGHTCNRIQNIVKLDMLCVIATPGKKK